MIPKKLISHLHPEHTVTISRRCTAA